MGRMKNHVAGKEGRRRGFRRGAVLTDSELVEQELAKIIETAREVALAAAAEFDRVVSGSASKGLRARPGYEDVLGYMASWCRYVQLGGVALHRMEDAGDHFFAASLRRSLLEHGVAMWTLAQDPGVHQAFVRAHQHSIRKMQGAMSDVGLDPHPDAATVLAWETDPATNSLDNLQRAKHRFEQFGESGARLYVQWLQETQLSHSGFPTSVIYLRETDDDVFPTLTENAMVPVNQFGAEMTAADAMTLALESLGLICEKDPFGQTVKNLNDIKNSLVEDYAGALERLAELERQDRSK